MSAKQIQTYSLFHNYRIKYNQKYFIIEGEYDMLPLWHSLHNEDYVFDYNNCGIVEVYRNEKNEPVIKVINPIDGGNLYDEIDYYVADFADLKSENENGEKNKLPDILKLYFKNYVHCKDTDVGTILTEDDIKHLNNKENEDNDYYSDDDYGACPICYSSESCECGKKCDGDGDGDYDNDYDECDAYTEYYCEKFYNK